MGCLHVAASVTFWKKKVKFGLPFKGARISVPAVQILIFRRKTFSTELEIWLPEWIKTVSWYNSMQCMYLIDSLFYSVTHVASYPWFLFNRGNILRFTFVISNGYGRSNEKDSCQEMCVEVGTILKENKRKMATNMSNITLFKTHTNSGRKNNFFKLNWTFS